MDDTVFEGCSNIQYAEYGNCKYLGNPSNPYLVLMKTVSNHYSAYTIHNDTKVIADAAFYGCKDMTDITIPAGVVIIGADAFDSCESLASVSIPDSVTTICEFAFEGCKSLTSITIPNSISALGNFVFKGCVSLTEICFTGTKEQWQAIEKTTLWNNYLGDYTIRCTDGDIDK
jgi:hypothetical protein